jgi:hypothetical protein
MVEVHFHKPSYGIISKAHRYKVPVRDKKARNQNERHNLTEASLHLHRILWDMLESHP